MSSKLVAVGLLVTGVLLFLVALAADSLGLGPFPGIGLRQIAGAILGVVLAAVGMVRLRRGG